MNSQKVCLLLVSFLLLCGMIGCGQKPEPVVDQPKTTVEEPKPLPQPVVEEPKEPKPLASEQEVTEKPKVAMEKPEMAIAPFDADQAEQHQQAWAQYLGVPVEVTNSIGMKLRLIPAGEFMMGSPESDDEARD